MTRRAPVTVRRAPVPPGDAVKFNEEDGSPCSPEREAQARATLMVKIGESLKMDMTVWRELAGMGPKKTSRERFSPPPHTTMPATSPPVQMPNSSKRPPRHPNGMRTNTPPAVLRAMLKRDRNRCRKCGHGKHLEGHHVKAVADGGTHALKNLIALCGRCHNEWTNYEGLFASIKVPFKDWLVYPPMDAVMAVFVVAERKSYPWAMAIMGASVVASGKVPS